MINFTVGPVQGAEEILAIGGEQVPYFRTPEFSRIMLENEQSMLRLTHAPEGSRVVFLTGSGTASMEAAVMNTLHSADRALVVNGGSFGQRFAQLLELHEIPHSQLKLQPGRSLTEEDLAPYDGQGYTAFVINMHETSTGVLYDMELVSRFCRRNGLFLIVDAVSAFLADPFDMEAVGAGVMLTGSQKALACAPGVSILVLSPAAQERIAAGKTKCMYLDLKDALKNGERGQTPFTPAVGTLRQIHARLKGIEEAGGAGAEQKKTAERASYFRQRLTGLPFELFPESCSNAVTSLMPTTQSAYRIFEILKDEYGIWICPNGGEFRDKVFRVGHIGALMEADYDALLEAFRDLQRRGII